MCIHSHARAFIHLFVGSFIRLFGGVDSINFMLFFFHQKMFSDELNSIAKEWLNKTTQTIVAYYVYMF